MEIKKVFIDLETTGLDPLSNGIIQIGALYEDEVLDLRIQPFPDDVITDEALELHGLTKEDLKQYMPPEKAKRVFTDWLDSKVNKYDRNDKLYFIGYNSHSFDSPFLRQWFLKNGDKYYGSYFWHPSIDIMLLTAYIAIGQRQKLENFKLVTVAKSLGYDIKEDELHDAVYDAKLTKYIFEILYNEYPP